MSILYNLALHKDGAAQGEIFDTAVDTGELMIMLLMNAGGKREFKKVS